MSDQTSLFGTNNPQETPAPATPTPNVDPVATTLQSIKNEKGEPKYKTVEEAMKALQHAQAHIPAITEEKKRMEFELEQLRSQVSKVNELEDTVKKLLSNTSAPATPAAPTIDEGKLKELISNSINEVKTQEEMANNAKSVVATVASKFGDKAEEVFYGKAAELGMSRAEINHLAATRPKAVLNLLGIQDTAVPPQSRQQSTQGTALNTAGVEPTQTTYIGKNKEPVIIGATTQQVRQETDRAKKMVEELHAQGKTVYDLTDPKVYFKYFG